MRGICLDFDSGIEGKVCSVRSLRSWWLIFERGFCREYLKPDPRCVSRTQRNNEDTLTPVPFQVPRDESSSTSALNTDSLLHGNDTNNLSDERSSVSAAPSASCTMSRYSPHVLNASLLDPKDYSNTFGPHHSAMLRGSGLDTGSSSVLHRPMLSDGALVSDRASLDQYTIPVSRSSSYSTTCRSTHPLLDQRLQGGYHAVGSHLLPNWYSYHRARDTSLEQLETRYLKILQERSRPSKYEASLASVAPASQGPINEILEDALPSMDLSRTAREEARKITDEVATSGLLSLQGSQFLQLRLQDSLQRSLETLGDHYQDNLQRALASLNLQSKDGEVCGRENENGKIAIDEEQHKCLDCNKVKKTHSDLKCVAPVSFLARTLRIVLCMIHRERRSPCVGKYLGRKGSITQRATFDCEGR